MRSDYLANGSPDCPLLRLSHFSPSEAESLFIALSELATDAIQTIALLEMPWVQAVGDTRLTLRRCWWDQAVIRTGERTFECGLTAGTWDNVAGLVEPFAHAAGGFQWLAATPGEANLLLSADGSW